MGDQRSRATPVHWRSFRLAEVKARRAAAAAMKAELAKNSCRVSHDEDSGLARDSNLGHHLTFPPAKRCSILASWTAQPGGA